MSIEKNNNEFFKHKVLAVVEKIPKGSTLTYKEVAEMVGSPRAFRAVGSIVSKNYNKKIPCHRVVRSDYTVGQYNRGQDKKIKLLREEGIVIHNKKISRP